MRKIALICHEKKDTLSSLIQRGQWRWRPTALETGLGLFTMPSQPPPPALLVCSIFHLFSLFLFCSFFLSLFLFLHFFGLSNFMILYYLLYWRIYYTFTQFLIVCYLTYFLHLPFIRSILRSIIYLYLCLINLKYIYCHLPYSGLCASGLII